MSIKKIILKIHLYIGLAIGLLFFITSLSGALYTWAPEFRSIKYKQQITPEDRETTSIASLKSELQREMPEGDFRTVTYRGKDQSMEVLLFVPGTYFTAQLNPYSGKLIHLQDMNQGWINKLNLLHRNLLLGPFGRKIVHWVTLLALPMLISGIILWWPSNKKNRKRSFFLKWKASFKRINYDLHNVLGFYASWVLILSLITGIFWGFEIVRESLKSLTQENTQAYEQPKSKIIGDPTHTDPLPLMDSLMKNYRDRFPDKYVNINLPHQEEEAIHVTIIHPRETVRETDHYYHDRYRGQLLEGNFEHGIHQQSSLYHTLHALVYDIHLGNVLGIPGRIIICIASLIAASLPITGFCIWWNKRKKKSFKIENKANDKTNII